MMPERENNSFWEIAEIIDREMSILRKMRPVGPKEKALRYAAKCRGVEIKVEYVDERLD